MGEPSEQDKQSPENAMGVPSKKRKESPENAPPPKRICVSTHDIKIAVYVPPNEAHDMDTQALERFADQMNLILKNTKTEMKNKAEDLISKSVGIHVPVILNQWTHMRCDQNPA